MIMQILKSYFGYDNLKEEQEKIINNVIKRKDTIGLLPTGFGKSLTFQIPALLFEGVTIVITPLIALMQDQVINLKGKGVKAEYINSLQSEDDQNIIYSRLKHNKIKILYVSAERLKSKRFLNEIEKVDIDFLVCDEAHTLLWSEDFRHALGEIPAFIKRLPKRPRILALTATATSNTTEKITKLLELDNPDVVIGDCDRKNIFYDIKKTHDKDRDLFFYLKRKQGLHGLVYCLTIKNVVHVYEYLKSKGFNVLKYHGAMDSNEKKEALELYKNNMCDIIVCTNAFGMGIDIPDIRYVVEYDLPANIEDFMQQTGRGSRDGKRAEGVVLFNINDVKTIDYFIDHIEDPEKSDKEIIKIKNDRRNKLDKMVELCMSSKCIHKSVSEYFGIKHPGKCGMCINCVPSKYKI